MAANRPTAAELLEAIHEFLSGEVMNAIDAGDVAFRLRVALNALQLVQRECERAPGNDTRERSRLQALLGSGEERVDALNADLCLRIRNGEFDDRLEELLPCLEACTLDKLGVDNPRYSTYRHLAGGD